MHVLNDEEIKNAIEQGLVEELIDLGTQLQPNGFDMTLASVFSFQNSGKLDFSNSERELPEIRELKPEKMNDEDKYGWYNLKSGIYKVRTNEKFNMPNDIIAIANPRSSLLRMGAFTQTGVWDAGFSGKAEFILQVSNSHGVKLKENARIAQLLFIKINEVQNSYSGRYNEK